MSVFRPLDADSHLYLIDASGFIFRAYHALPPLTRASDNMPVGAVAGFCNMLWKMLRDMRETRDSPSHILCAFDKSSHSFRNALYPQYKAHRPPVPEDLSPQFPFVRRAAKAFGIPAIEMDGFEADDIIASYARNAEAAGAKITIISSDKDLMQLIGSQTSMFDAMKNRHIGPQQVLEKFGVGPEQVIEVQALAGDSTDNIPGIPGIGIKTAAALIARFGSLEALLEGADSITQPGRRNKIITHAENARLSKKLVTLDTNVPLPVELEQTGLADPDPDLLLGFLREMEFRTLGQRISDALGKEKPQDAKKPPDYLTITDSKTLRQWTEQAKAQGMLAIKTISNSSKPVGSKLLGIGLALTPEQAGYVPLGRGGSDLFDGDAPEHISLTMALEILQTVLEDASVLKIGHDIKHDYIVLKAHGLETVSMDDVMLLSFVTAAGRRNDHGLSALARELLERELPKGFKPVDAEIKDCTAYAANAAELALRLWSILKPELVRQSATTIYQTIERPLIPVIADMERAGIRIDQHSLAVLSEELTGRMAQMEQQAHSQAGREFNLASPKQLGDILFGELKLPGGKKTKTGAWSTTAMMLEDLASNDNELARTLLDWRMLAKLKSTYTEALLGAVNQESGRIHTSYSLAGAQTGRLSSTEPNLQNIPVRTSEGRKIRQAFIAAPDHVLISADYSQIELRLLAHIARIESLIEAFRRGEDIHAATAAEIFGGSVENIDPQSRRRAKMINFGIIYGISAFGLARRLGIARHLAEQYINSYFDKFPGIKAYMHNSVEFARANGYVETIFGRHCHLPAIRARQHNERSFAERQAINAPVQGSAADIIKRAMIRIPAAMDGLKARMLLQVHDELLFEAPEDEAEQVISIVREVMENAAMPAQQIAVPLTIAAKTASNWADAH